MKLLGAEVSPAGLLEKHWLTSDGGRDQIVVERIQDVEPILKKNQAAFNDAPTSYGKSEMGKVADIPAVVIEEMCRLHQITFKELMDQRSEKSLAIWNELLNGRDFRYFRTRPGVVTVRGR